MRVQAGETVDGEAREVRAAHEEAEETGPGIAVEGSEADLRAEGREGQSRRHVQGESLVAAQRTVGPGAHREAAHNARTDHRKHDRGVEAEGEDAEDPALLDGALLLLVEVGVDLNAALLQEHGRVVLAVHERLEVDGSSVERCRPECPGHDRQGEDRTPAGRSSIAHA